MLRRRSWARLALLVGVLSGVAALGGACSDDQPLSSPVPMDSGAASEASVGAGICPSTAPVSGEACTLPEGTTCAFGACGTPIAECRGGVWRYGGNPPPRPLCPAPEPPPSESACPPCWPTGATCSYGACSGPDASTNTAVASCSDGVWVIAVSACPPTDAGADVQGDASPDAD